MVRIIFALVALLTFAQTVVAQQPRASVGGTVNFVTQAHSTDQPLGGTTLGGSALFSVRVSSRVAIEFEPSFGGSSSWQYTYRPLPSSTATVVAARHDTSFPVQARIRVSVLEPVAGVAVVRSKLERHAALGGTPYFDDSRSDYDLALIGGLDVGLRVAKHVDAVPTFRVLLVPRGSHSSNDPLGEQTSTGWLTFRYGFGARVAF